MQAVTMTAKEFASLSVIGDLKELCGENFEKVESKLRLALLSTLTQFRLLKHCDESPYFTWELMEEAANSVPSVVWLGQREVKERLLRCWQLDEDAITHLIQLLAEAI